jgi:hypothetical protein
MLHFIIPIGAAVLLTGCGASSGAYYTQTVQGWKSIMHPYLKTLVALLLAAFTTCTYAEVNDDSPVDNKSTYHITNAIDLVSATDIQYEKPKIMIKMVFPRLTNSDDSDTTLTASKGNEDLSNPANDNESTNTSSNHTSSAVDAFNQQMTKVINEEIAYFKQKVAEADTYQKTLEKSKVKNRLTIDYNSAVINLEEEPIISIRLVVQGSITGIAHPFNRYRTVNFDIGSGKEIQLSELFKADSNYLEVISQLANAELSRKLHNNMLANGAASSEANFNNWNININGLRITFDETTVAPATLGSQSILIPYSTIKKIIEPESSLGRCLQHRTRCMRDPLLTGGFIDEAANTSDSRLNPVLS